MSGNVWEWCWDWYNDENKDRVLRGGSWRGNAFYSRVSYRINYSPGYRNDYFGFRLACSLQFTKPEK